MYESYFTEFVHDGFITEDERNALCKKAERLKNPEVFCLSAALAFTVIQRVQLEARLELQR